MNDQLSSSKFLRRASEIKFISSNRLYQNPAFAKAMQSQPGTKEYADAMHELGIADSLTVIAHKNLEASPLQSFLPPPTEIISQYDNIEDKIDTLLGDPRFVVNRMAIETRIAQETGGSMGILEWAGQGQYIDMHGNPRNNYGVTEGFICQYIREVTVTVAALFQSWHSSSNLNVEKILERIQLALPDYDLGIVKNGLESFFDGNYIAATHALIPQFENILRQWAKLKGAETKKYDRQNIASEKLLHDFINPANTEMQALLGGELYALIAWLMVNDGPFDYRNKLAHGWLTAQECGTEHVPSITIFLILKVIAI